MKIVDVFGNVTKNVSKKEKLNVEMKFCSSQTGLPLPYKADVSQLGKGTLKGSPINLKKITKETEIKVCHVRSCMLAFACSQLHIGSCIVGSCIVGICMLAFACWLLHVGSHR